MADSTQINPGWHQACGVLGHPTSHSDARWTCTSSIYCGQRNKWQTPGLSPYMVGTSAHRTWARISSMAQIRDTDNCRPAHLLLGLGALIHKQYFFLFCHLVSMFFHSCFAFVCYLLAREFIVPCFLFSQSYLKNYISSNHVFLITIMYPTCSPFLWPNMSAF